MFNSRQIGNSPMGLRDDLNNEDTNETYHPKKLVRQPNLSSLSEINKIVDSKQSGSKTKWLPRMSSVNQKQSSTKSWKELFSQKMARISSLDSTRSSSSIEAESEQTSAKQQQIPPTISITSSPLDQTQHQSNARLRHELYNNYYGRSRHGAARDKDEDSEEDEDDDLPLPIPYSSSSMSRSTVIRQQTTRLNELCASNPSYQPNNSNLEDLLDDRQGMNSSEQQYTKGERAAAAALDLLNRPSIDGSINSEFKNYAKDAGRAGNSSSSVVGKRIRSKRDKRRSKSPSSMGNFNFLSRSSTISSSKKKRSGFLRLASKLKLTRKHESIAKLQLSILNSGFVSLKTMDKDLATFLPKERMTPKEFEERVKLMRKYEVLAQIEYKFASRYETYVCRHAVQEPNQCKNISKKCIPYDYNRVVLKTIENKPHSDYINASHVDSYLKPNAYIAAQGPNENTIEDFWRMIWEQKSFVIVMLTKVFDFIHVMCNQYWPVEVNKCEKYGNLGVTLLYEEPLADFVIRTIKLTKLKGNQANDDKLAAGTSQKVDLASEPGEQEASRINAKLSDAEEDARYDDEEDYTDDEDDTSASDLPDDELASPSQQRGQQNNNSLNVRVPRYASRSRRRISRRTGRLASDNMERASSIAGSDRLTDDQMEARRFRSSSQPPTDIARVSQEGEQRRLDDNFAQPSPAERPNEFLHPLINAHYLATSASSLSSVPMTPMSPTTPRTPTSVGLDRSSATRKAVKKKRRIREKNKRPMQTQFQVPDESQLVDDDDESNNGDGDNSKFERIIYQFHYNSWASHTCPFISSLLHFRRRVRICMDEMSKSGKTGPTIVHCSDGCGRTGTYLAIDANLELGEEDNVYDVFNYTKMMRQSRKFLIENLEQYKFVYDTIEEAMFCGRTWFPVVELHKRLKHKSQRNPITKKNEYQREYEKITRMTSKFSIGDCAGGHRVENREKNRDVSTVPPDNFRPYLTSFQSNDNTDYINAVFVDGYTRSKEYIVTEWPMHKTISDFWSLVYDHDCNSVILLANPPESSTYPSFLPSEKELKRWFGPVFSAEMVSYTHYQNIKSWIYTIGKKNVGLFEVLMSGQKTSAKTAQVFQITCWPQGHRVPTSTNALVELMNMVERWRQRTAYGPVCVVSLDGKSRAGVYCAANVAIEQVVQHSEVDVFQAVKTVRRHRPHLIENMTEYKYCYDLILHYVLHYVNQTPVNS